MNDNTSCSNITAAVESIIDGVDALCLSMINIDKISFHSIYSDFERLEESLNRKTFIDAAFAFMAERDEAGRLVGSSVLPITSSTALDSPAQKPTNALPPAGISMKSSILSQSPSPSQLSKNQFQNQTLI